MMSTSNVSASEGCGVYTEEDLAFYESLKEESEEYLVVFLRKIGDSELEVVKEDDELNDMLLARVTGEFIAEEIEKKLNDQKKN